MATIWYEGKVIARQEIAPQVIQLQLEVQGTACFEYTAGQFITMDLPIGEKRLQRWRSYSLAGAPNGTNILELCIVRSASGIGTQFLFEQAQVGYILRFKGPDGTFVLPQTIDKEIVMVCTGTGVAPFRSMILDLHQKGLNHRGIHLIFGTRREESILYRAELEALSHTIPQFRYDIALSQQPDWAGYKGYVHQIYLEQYATPHPNRQFYLCGWSNMIDQAVAHLIIDCGYERGQVIYELYG